MRSLRWKTFNRSERVGLAEIAEKIGKGEAFGAGDSDLARDPFDIAQGTLFASPEERLLSG